MDNLTVFVAPRDEPLMEPVLMKVTPLAPHKNPLRDFREDWQRVAEQESERQHDFFNYRDFYRLLAEVLKDQWEISFPDEIPLRVNGGGFLLDGRDPLHGARSRLLGKGVCYPGELLIPDQTDIQDAGGLSF
jgi:hypothetical protein